MGFLLPTNDLMEGLRVPYMTIFFISSLMQTWSPKGFFFPLPFLIRSKTMGFIGTYEVGGYEVYNYE